MGDCFEAVRSLNQELAFETVKTVFKIILPDINAKHEIGKANNFKQNQI